MERATRGGHLEVVKLLHEIGATCTSIAVHLAKVHGHHDVYRFLNTTYPGKVRYVLFLTTFEGKTISLLGRSKSAYEVRRYEVRCPPSSAT